MLIVTSKCIILVVLFMATLVFSMLPVLLRNLIRSQTETPQSSCSLLISLLNCFAGGVFMATGFLDLFPEVDEALQKASWTIGYPVAEFLTAVGFFLVLIVEQVVLHFKERAFQAAQHDDEEPVVPQRSEQHPADHLLGSLVGVSDHLLVTSTSSSIQGNDALVQQSDSSSSFRAILLAAALSLHSVFEGLAIGLQPDINKLLQIFIAVLLHKSVIAFSLGLKLVQSELKFWTVIESTMAFCLASPIGLGLALGLEEYGHSVDSSTMNGVLQGLACGTFFYVTFFEVLPHELNLGGKRLLKTFAIIVGFAGISAVLILDPDNQSSATSRANLLLSNSTYLHLM